jgi:hypothetical protein
LLGCLRCCMAFNIQESDIWDRWAKTASLNLVCFLPRLGKVVIDAASTFIFVPIKSFQHWESWHRHCSSSPDNRICNAGGER